MRTCKAMILWTDEPAFWVGFGPPLRRPARAAPGFRLRAVRFVSFRGAWWTSILLSRGMGGHHVPQKKKTNATVYATQASGLDSDAVLDSGAVLGAVTRFDSKLVRRWRASRAGRARMMARASR